MLDGNRRETNASHYSKNVPHHSKNVRPANHFADPADHPAAPHSAMVPAKGPTNQLGQHVGLGGGVAIKMPRMRSLLDQTRSATDEHCPCGGSHLDVTALGFWLPMEKLKRMRLGPAQSICQARQFSGT